VHAIGTPRADVHDGPESIRLHGRGRRYDCSPTLRAAIQVRRTSTALRARQGPAAAFGGSLRAALTRAPAAASVQLCDEGKAFVVQINGRAYWNVSVDAFYLTEESRYQPVRDSPNPGAAQLVRNLYTNFGHRIKFMEFREH